MPAKRLTGQAFYPREFDVIGEDGESPYIRHVGLAAESGRQARERAAVHQMGPPLATPGEMRADVQGEMGLTENEVKKMRVFVDLHAQEHAARRLGVLHGYCIHPHCLEVREADGTVVYTRFSCAGFAIEAYHFARLEPLDVSAVPQIGLEEIVGAYPDAAGLLQVERFRSQMGLAGKGPWPVVLCGYFVHAFDRSGTEIRERKYVPTREDRHFPRVPVDPAART